jgi:integrase
MSRPNQGPQLRQRKDRGNTYEIRWTDTSGRDRRLSTGTSDRGEAHKLFGEWLENREPDRIEWTAPRRAAQTSIADVLDLYATEHAPQVIGTQTIGYAMRALLDWWGDRTCDYIRPETCRAYVRARDVKPATAARELSVMSAALGYAFKNGKLVDRPFVELPPKSEGRDRWLTRSEAARLLWESRRDPQARGHLPLFILLALATGARPTALFELRWTQIDFDRGIVNLNQPGRQQTNKRRPVIPLPRRLRWFLLRAHSRASSPYVLSFHGRQIGSVKKAFRRARDRAGLGPDVIPYTLRHTCGTWAAQAGVDLWLIGGWLGHTQQRTTELYAHHSPGHLAAVRKVMD